MDARYILENEKSAASFSGIETHYPHMVVGLLKAWPNSVDTDRYLNSILVDDRDSRQGLPAEIFDELMFLSELNWRRMHFNERGVQISADIFSFGTR